MTTHQHPAETTPALEGDEQSAAMADPRRGHTDPPPSGPGEPTGNIDAAASAVSAGDGSAATADAAQPDESLPDRALFADDELTGLRMRWDDVQAGFVDDPQDCIHKADGLVSDVVEQLTNSFAEARSRLEQQWVSGEEASTENLRIALKRYRQFFERLLTV